MTLNERVEWEKEVSQSFAESVRFYQKRDITTRPFDRTKELVVLDYLIDTQELIQLGNLDKANDMLERVKFIIQCETALSVRDTLENVL